MAAPIRIGDLLRDKGYIDDEHIRYALQVQKVTKEKLGQVLTRTGLVSEYDLVSTVAQQLKLEYVNLERVAPDYELLKRFNRNTCLAQRVFPYKKDENEIVAAVADVPESRVEQFMSAPQACAPSSSWPKKAGSCRLSTIFITSWTIRWKSSCSARWASSPEIPAAP
jgi:hypothetical protein